MRQLFDNQLAMISVRISKAANCTEHAKELSSNLNPKPQTPILSYRAASRYKSSNLSREPYSLQNSIGNLVLIQAVGVKDLGFRA